MEGGKTKWARLALTAALLAPAGGCVAAAAGAGAGSAIYLTSRGASSTVNGSVIDVAARTRSVLDGEGITITETKTESEGDERSFKGTKGDLDVSVWQVAEQGRVVGSAGALPPWPPHNRGRRLAGPFDQLGQSFGDLTRDVAPVLHIHRPRWSRSSLAVLGWA